jgi:hypothetical protein
MFKAKHKSGTISPKIMINSGKVHLGILRLYSEVELKDLFIFGYKNHEGRYSIKIR